MFESELLRTSGFALIVLLVCVLIGVGLRWLRDRKQGYPGEEAIEGALFPFVSNAIWLAYKASESLIDQGQERLQGMDKKRLADAAYDLLPSSIPVKVRGVVIHVPLNWIKRLVSKDRFSALVQDAFDDFSEWYDTVQLRVSDELADVLAIDVGYVG